MLRDGELGDALLSGLLGCGGGRTRRLPRSAPLLAGEYGEKAGDAFDILGLTTDVRGVGEAGRGLFSGGGVTELALGET